MSLRLILCTLLCFAFTALSAASLPAKVKQNVAALKKGSELVFKEYVDLVAKERVKYFYALDKKVSKAAQENAVEWQAAVVTERKKAFKQDALPKEFLKASCKWRSEEELEVTQEPAAELFADTTLPSELIKEQDKYHEEVADLFSDAFDKCQKFRKKVITTINRELKKAKRNENAELTAALEGQIETITAQNYLLDIGNQTLRRWRMDNRLPVDGKITYLFAAFDKKEDAENHLLSRSYMPQNKVVNSPLENDGKCLNMELRKAMDVYSVVALYVQLPRGDAFKVGPNSYVTFEVLKKSAPHVGHLMDIDTGSSRGGPRVNGFVYCSEADWKNNEWFTMKFKVSGDRMRRYSNSKVNQPIPKDGTRLDRFEFHADMDLSGKIEFFLIRNLHVYEEVQEEK